MRFYSWSSGYQEEPVRRSASWGKCLFRTPLVTHLRSSWILFIHRMTQRPHSRCHSALKKFIGTCQEAVGYPEIMSSQSHSFRRIESVCQSTMFNPSNKLKKSKKLKVTILWVFSTQQFLGDADCEPSNRAETWGRYEIHRLLLGSGHAEKILLQRGCPCW